MTDPIQQVFAIIRTGRALEAAEIARLVPAPWGGRAALSLRELVSLAGLALPQGEGGQVLPRPRPFTCGIINARSGRCTEDCAFCAQSRHYHTNTPVYPLVDKDTLLRRARELARHGVTRMGIVTAGAGPGEADFDRICAAAGRIRREVEIALCASLGVLTRAKAVRLKDAGFTSYHHNLETARSYYPAICTSHDYERRCETVRLAAEAGLRVCSGGLFGLGESWEQRIELAATLRELNVDSIPINFLMPIPGTPLEKAPRLRPEEGLAVVALFRLMHPGRDIVICGGRTTTLGNWDLPALFSCANGMMVGDYLTEKGGPFERDMALARELEHFQGESALKDTLLS